MAAESLSNVSYSARRSDWFNVSNISAWRARATGSTDLYSDLPLAVIETITGAASASAERPRVRIVVSLVRPRFSMTRSVRLTWPLSMPLRVVTSEKRIGAKRAIRASRRHSGRLRPNSSRYGLVRLLRRAFDSRVSLNVRKSSTFRFEPFLLSEDQGRVARAEARFCGFFLRVVVTDLSL